MQAMNDISKILRQEREMKGISRKEMAEKLGIPLNTPIVI